MNNKPIADIVREVREDMPQKLEGFKNGELVVLDTAKLADRIEAAHELELAVEKANAAGEGYIAGKQSVTDCNQPVTDCNGLNAAKIKLVKVDDIYINPHCVEAVFFRDAHIKIRTISGLTFNVSPRGSCYEKDLKDIVNKL